MDFKQIRKIESILNLFPEVTWDRWGGEMDAPMVVFGWIARQDDKSDFLVLYLSSGAPVGFTTSSASHSAVIAKRLGMDHSDCKRVEHHFPSAKAIHLVGDDVRSL